MNLMRLRANDVTNWRQVLDEQDNPLPGVVARYHGVDIWGGARAIFTVDGGPRMMAYALRDQGAPVPTKCDCCGAALYQFTWDADTAVPEAEFEAALALKREEYAQEQQMKLNERRR